MAALTPQCIRKTARGAHFAESLPSLIVSPFKPIQYRLLSDSDEQAVSFGTARMAG
jgi:hypothetical protein